MKIKITLLLLLFTLQAAFGQVHLGIKGGISTTDVDPNELLVTDENGLERLEVALNKANYGVHAGIVIQAYFNKFVVQPEVNFNSNKVSYQLSDLTTSSTVTEIRSEKYQYVDIPVLIGFQFGPVRLQAGPEAHFFVASISEIEEEDPSYAPSFDTATFGWLGSFGFDLWRSLMIDVRYEGNFSKFGSHFEFNGNAYEFDQSPARLLFSLGYMFGKKKDK